MRKSMDELVYKAFHLYIKSDIVLPELQPCAQHGVLTDLKIELADLNLEWEAVAKENDMFVIKPNMVLFRIPNVAIYSITNGNRISISPFIDAKEDQVRLYILGTCMGAILLQRKILPLHGSAVVVGNRAYAIVGNSGAGKSTLASAFLNRGYQLLSDDVIPVTLLEGEVPIITPAYPQQKLWLESLNQFGMKEENLRPIVGREAKYAVPVTTQFMDRQIPLSGIFELVKSNVSEIDISPINSLTQIHTLYAHTYRNFFISSLGLLHWHFQKSVKIASTTSMYRLNRPINRFTANELVDVILANIKGEVGIL